MQQNLMFSPLTSVLIKIFVKGFYRVHSGLFLFLFISVITYCFFIEVLNKTHLPPDQIILNHLLFVLTLISSPVIVGLVFLLWLILTVKSWSYILLQMAVPSNQFLFYSATALNKSSQFKSWFIVQFIISLPLLGYGLFALIIGVIFGYYIIPVVILAYVMLLALVSAVVYVRRANQPVRMDAKPLLSRVTVRWRKPFFSLYLYHVANQQKVGLLITKLLSYGLISGGSFLLADVNDKLVVAGIITLGIITTHSFLIYQSYRFENGHLSFSLNFPYSKTQVYFYWAASYSLLTLPENIWLLSRFDLTTGIFLLIFNIGSGMLLHNLLYAISLDMQKYLRWVFYLFALFFLLILINLLWLLVPLNLLFSIALLNRKYYRQKSFIKS